MKRNLFITLLLAIACLLLCATASAASSAPDGIASDAEWRLLERFNTYRLANGAEPLTMGKSLQSAAQKRADELDTLNRSSRPDGSAWETVLAEYSISYASANASYMQNLRDGTTAPATIVSVISDTGNASAKAFREAVLSSQYTHIGIGSTSSGYWYWILVGNGSACNATKAELRNPSAAVYVANASIENMGLILSKTCALHGECFLPVTSDMCKVTKDSNVATVTVYGAGAAAPKSIALPNEFPKPTSATLNYTELTVYKGKSNLLVAQLQPSSAKSATNVWTSSDAAVVSVSSTGLVTGLKEGVATVTYAGDNGVTAKCSITVKDRADSVTLAMENLVLGLGQTYQAEYALQPIGSTEPVSWSIYPATSKVASVSGTGLVTAGKVAGKAYVICTTANGKTDRIKLTVVESSKAVQSVKISMTSGQVAPGGSIRLAARVYPGTALKRGITWVSSNPAIATVSADGVVTGVAVGSVNITALSSSGAKAVCQVKVQEIAVTSILFKRGSANLYVGQHGVLAPSVQPASAGNRTLTWKSSDITVARVNDKGNVTALKKGSALITATAVNGVQGSFTVNVQEYAVTKIKLAKTTASMSVGNSGVIRVGVGPSKATNKTVVWSSSNPAVATVDQSGRITGVGGGTTLITAASESNPEVKTSCKLTVYANAFKRTSAPYTTGKASAWVTDAKYSAEGNLEVTICYYNSKGRAVAIPLFGDEVLLYSSNTTIFKRLPIPAEQVSSLVLAAGKSTSVTYTFSIAKYPELANQNLRKLNANSRIG